MSKLNELKLKVRHVVDFPGHPDYGSFVYVFNENQLREFVIEALKNSFSDTEADGNVYCGKCGKPKTL